MDAAVLRDDMVEGLTHESKGWLRSPPLADAMRTVPREPFLPDDRDAYADRDHAHLGTRILAPSTVARLLEALEPEEGNEVLVVGAGVGYTPAVLAELVGAASVQAVDITRRLVYESRSNLAAAGYGGVLVDCRDGADGLPEYAPYDRILVEAAAVRPPTKLVDQLATDGRLVMPVGAGTQHLTVVEADGETIEHGACAFDPLLVEGEQADTLERNRTRREDREFAERAARRRKGWELEWIDWEGEGR